MNHGTIRRALAHARIILETLQDAGKVRCPDVIKEIGDAEAEYTRGVVRE